MKGVVFDIQRGAMTDGPGIRTTVFMKGCPLDCRWCHNPESKSGRIEVLNGNHEQVINKLKKFQPDVNWRLDINGGILPHDPKYAEILNCAAVTVSGKWMAVEEVIEVVKKDLHYYPTSGGGLTLSGGEPLYQFEFTSALLTASKSLNIHNCLDTSGYVTINKLEHVLDLVDIFLFDYKISDANAHKKFTGVNNKSILNALKFLNDNKANIILRCPIIPGINDHNAHFASISRLSRQNKAISGIEILPYHDYWSGKFLTAPETEFMIPDDNLIQQWDDTLKALNCNNYKIKYPGFE